MTGLQIILIILAFVALVRASLVSNAKQSFYRVDTALSVAKKIESSAVQQDISKILSNTFLVNKDYPMKLSALMDEARIAADLTPPDLVLAAAKQKEAETLQSTSDRLLAQVKQDMLRYTQVFDLVDESSVRQKDLQALAEEYARKELFSEASEAQIAADNLRDKVSELVATPFYQIASAQLGDHSSAIGDGDGDGDQQSQVCELPKSRLIKEIEEVLLRRESESEADVDTEYAALTSLQDYIEKELQSRIETAEQNAIDSRKLAKAAEVAAQEFALAEDFSAGREKKAESDRHIADAARYEREVLTVNAELLTKKDNLFAGMSKFIETQTLHERASVEISRLAAAGKDAIRRVDLTEAESLSDQKKVYQKLANRLDQTPLSNSKGLERMAAEKAETEKKLAAAANSAIKTAVKLWLSDEAQAVEKYGPISNWDTSKVTDMSYLFYRASSFNGDISRWNTGKVTTMEEMFYQATAFNRDISQWKVNTGSTKTSWMFYQCPIQNSYKPKSLQSWW